MTLQPKKSIVVPAGSYGVCLWQFDDGTYLGDGEGYLSLEGIIGDRRVEQKMRVAARHYLGNNEGKPKWMQGRKVSNMEYEDQYERLLEGKIPDPVDEVNQIMRRA